MGEKQFNVYESKMKYIKQSRKHGRFLKSTNAFVRCRRCNKFTKSNAMGNNYDLKCVQCKCYENKQPIKQEAVETLVFDDKNSNESGVAMNHSLQERVATDIIVETVFSDDDGQITSEEFEEILKEIENIFGSENSIVLQKQ